MPAMKRGARRRNAAKPHPLVARVESGPDRYTLFELEGLLDRSKASVWRYRVDERIRCDLFEGGSKWVSRAEVLRFLREDFLVGPEDSRS